MHVEAISSEVNNFIHLLSNESLIILNNTENFITKKVENLYDNLLIYIMSKFETKSVKYDNEDLKYSQVINLTPDITDDKDLNKIAETLQKYHLSVNFDQRDYIKTEDLEKFLESIEEFINKDEAPIDLFIVFPIFFIPFIARFRLEYGFEIGIKIFTENHRLITDFYGEAHSSASVSAGVELGVLEFGGGLRGLLGYGRVGMKPFIDFKYLMSKIEYYVKLATLKFQVFAYLEMLFPRIKWISFRFIFITIKIPIIIFIQTRFEIGSQWTQGLQKYISTTKNF
jgi:hypothetical protein